MLILLKDRVRLLLKMQNNGKFVWVLQVKSLLSDQPLQLELVQSTRLLIVGRRFESCQGIYLLVFRLTNNFALRTHNVRVAGSRPVHVLHVVAQLVERCLERVVGSNPSKRSTSIAQWQSNEILYYFISLQVRILLEDYIKLINL